MKLKIGITISLVCIFISCTSNLTDKEKEHYTIKGKEIAVASFNELSSQLMEQMKLGGPNKAIPFCNENALPITNQLSEKYQVTIKRTSDKLRNKQNAPNEREQEIIEEYKKQQLHNEKLNPIVEIDANNKKHFYAPIIMKSNCLVCHGKRTEMLQVKTDSILKTLYPNDEATAYSEGELRGIWSITFKN